MQRIPLHNTRTGSPPEQGAELAPASLEGALSRTMYSELRAMAGAYMAGERAGHVLQPTALVHEAYVKLAGRKGALAEAKERTGGRGDDGGVVELPRDRAAFMAMAAVAMRRILVDYARGRDAVKRTPGGVSGKGKRVELHEDAIGGGREDADVLAVDEAVEKLAALSPRQARLVELRFFAGYSVADSAQILGVSRATCEADWRMARAWLRRELAEDASAEDASTEVARDDGGEAGGGKDEA